MKRNTPMFFLTFPLLIAAVGTGKDHFYEKGTLAEMKSQECGSEEKAEWE